MSSSIVNLANKKNFRVLDHFIFTVFPVDKKNHFLSTLKLFLGNEKIKLPVFAFFYKGDFPLLKKDMVLKDLALSDFSLYANRGDFSQVARFFMGIDNCSWQQDDCNDFSLRISFNPLSTLCEDSQFNKDFNNAINQACLVLMGKNRLLNHYSCTFYLPVYADEEPSDIDGQGQVKRIKYPVKTSVVDDSNAQKQAEKREKAEAQAYWYFHPPIRDYLFDVDDGRKHREMESIKEWQLTYDKKESGSLLYQWSVQPSNPEGDIQSIKADVTDVRVYKYFNNLCYLAITVKPSGEIDQDSAFYDDERWWYCLVFSTVDQWQLVKDRKMFDWLVFTKLARVLYPSFTQQEDEGKIAKHFLHLGEKKLLTTPAESNNLTFQPLGTDNFSELVFYFLKKFFDSGSLSTWLASDYNQVFDDRLFVNVAYGYVGSKLNSELENRLFMQALYVDTPRDMRQECDGFAYDPGFLNVLAKQHSYERWKALGIVSGYTSYSNVYIGKGCYFKDVIAKDHVPLIYGRMLLITLFYQASLRFYNRKIMKLTENFKGMGRSLDSDQFKKQLELVSSLREDFIRFTNVYWFHEVTSQIQGQEVFKLQQQALNLQKDYDFLKDEMERMDEYLQGRNNLVMEGQSKRLNTILFWFTMAALWMTLAELWTDDNINKYLKEFFYSSFSSTKTDDHVDSIKMLLSLGALSILFPLLYYIALPVLHRIKDVFQQLRKYARDPFLYSLLASMVGIAFYYF